MGCIVVLHWPVPEPVCQCQSPALGFDIARGPGRECLRFSALRCSALLCSVASGLLCSAASGLVCFALFCSLCSCLTPPELTVLTASPPPQRRDHCPPAFPAPPPPPPPPSASTSTAQPPAPYRTATAEHSTVIFRVSLPVFDVCAARLTCLGQPFAYQPCSPNRDESEGTRADLKQGQGQGQGHGTWTGQGKHSQPASPTANSKASKAALSWSLPSSLSSKPQRLQATAKAKPRQERQAAPEPGSGSKR
jgi:hypothetical protein